MSLQDDMDSKQDWTQDEINGLKQKYSRVHQTHFQGVVAHPVHPKDDPAWEYIGVGRWRKKREDAGGKTPEVKNG